MKEVRYTDHPKLRLQVRRIPEDLPNRIYLNAKHRYLDTETFHHIATMSMKKMEKKRIMMIAYDDYFSYVDIVTIHPISKNQKRNP